MQRHVQYLTIYSQNISGGKTKINALNNNIYRSAFDIILLQETWLNHRIDTAEILANSHYNAIRADRSQFKNTRKEGGGVLAFIKVGINYQFISLAIDTTIEFIAFKITLEGKTFFVINVYIPPYRNRMLALISELKTIIYEIRNHTDTM